MTDLENAKKLFRSGVYTCVLAKGQQVFSCQRRGIAPLVQLLDDKADFSGGAAADKVVGKAAAWLYVMLGVESVYAEVVSDQARLFLRAHGVGLEYETTTPEIKNRKGDGSCPMEQCVENCDDPDVVLQVLKDKMQELQRKSGKE